jgi:rubredoxin
MNVDKRVCPECRGKMTEGFLPEYTKHRVMRSLWIEGKLERSFWTGIHLKGKDIRAVITWRCTQCGLLRAYAEESVPPPGIFG